MDDVCDRHGCDAKADHAVWTTRNFREEIRTSVQWAYWQDEKKPPKKADKLCADHAAKLLAGMAETMRSGE